MIEGGPNHANSQNHTIQSNQIGSIMANAIPHPNTSCASITDTIPAQRIRRPITRKRTRALTNECSHDYYQGNYESAIKFMCIELP